MDHLSSAQLATLRAKLQAESEQLSRSLISEAGELANTPAAEPRDIEEAAAEAAVQFRDKAMRGRDQARLIEVDAALERMTLGSYGVCEDSDDEIPYRRLELAPTTRFTVEAQEQREHEAGVADPHGDEPIGY